MMVSEIELQHAESFHAPRADSDSRNYAAISGRTLIGPVFQVHMCYNFLELMELEFGHDNAKSKLLGSDMPREEPQRISEIQDTIPRVLNYYWKDLF